ncbi:MAG: hypothetical protein ABGZ24_03410, partial [Fuerstiella sp.]
MLCVLWSLTIGCGEEAKQTPTSSANSASQTVEKSTTAGDASLPQNEEFAPLRTSSSTHEDQQA